jgi:hypothetical protein
MLAMSAPAPLDILATAPAIVWLKTNAYAYPLLESLHLVAIGTLFGTILTVDLRILGLLRELAMRSLARALLPWTLGAFVLAALTGLTMFVARAGDFIGNRLFIAKLCLLFAAGLNAALLHARGPLDPTSGWTRVQAALSIVLWISVIFCGRWIAYT